MPKAPKRILSLLPAATETLFALGLGDRVVGVTHECDHPPAAQKLPRVTRPRVDPKLPSRALDAQVKTVAGAGRSLYELDAPLIASLKPDLVVTQVQCDVCAVTPKDLKAGLAQLKRRPKVIALESQTLETVMQDQYRLGRETDTLDVAKELLIRQWSLLKQVRRKVRGLPRRPVAVLDWLDPLMFAGNWMPELVEAAGGTYALVEAGKPSRWGTWKELAAAKPEAILAAPCGRDTATTAREWAPYASLAGAHRVPAVAGDRVFAADGHQYFNRPGPRLVFSAAILARVIHPEVPPLNDTLEAAFQKLSRAVGVAAPRGRRRT